MIVEYFCLRMKGTAQLKGFAVLVKKFCIHQTYIDNTRLHTCRSWNKSWCETRFRRWLYMAKHRWTGFVHHSWHWLKSISHMK